ncbi:glycine-rich domain-containing protein [Klebsiella quasipneumoniae]|uniref:glycine-rich domain-containing protein n=1 Tax=Klebsiella quasipneumoniae TaxID=1463165 RepID=UPI0038902A6F|nr:phage tail protein [Klebsiella quasipneumoniae subsp. similipneumoniae]
MRKVGSTTDTADANGEYTNGNVANGISPTIINAEMLNTFQRELVNVVEGSGLTLDPANDSQVLEAIKIIASGGRLINVKALTSSSVYVKPDSVKFVIADLIGGGGAGGSPAQNGVGFTSGSGGGNSGCHARVLIDMREVDTVDFTIGEGGIAVAGNNGGTGGVTSFGDFASVFGGNGGQILASSNMLNRIYGMSPLRDSYGSVNSALLLDFDFGHLGGDAIILSSGARAGFGGASAFGGNVFGPGNDTAGINAATYGGGGSGVVATNASFGTNLLGGNGAKGVIFIMEYA